jgi:predicted  nucleic acid-binding Zn-ribbon protein
LKVDIDNIEKEAADEIEQLAAENAAIREKNTKLNNDIDEIRAKYLAEIKQYFHDMDQNKRFIALLRDKIKTLQEENNNFGDTRPRTKSKKSSVQYFL